MNDSTIPDLLSRYTEAAIAHGRATESGDYKVANKNHDIVAAIYRRLRELGPDAQRQLLSLLAHADPSVRAWAASHALEFAPEQAEPVLAQTAQEAGIIGFTAETTLTEWRAGRLKFP